ncbi:MAG TPA: DUF1697 domain-containing protein [Acidimicrobiia bacterium]|nr:DUF1697 domain-containing protein [Acidimicrobiia bacterium]
MPRYIALLRGINVGGKHAVPMAKLRALCESLDLTEVGTYIQSGNVVFAANKAVTPAAFEKALRSEFGFEIPVVLRTRTELAKVVSGDPFKKVERSNVHVGFMAKKPAAAALKQIDHERFLPEAVVVKGCEVYYHLPNGMGRAKLPLHVDRQLNVPTTVRNWNTVTKLLALLHDR